MLECTVLDQPRVVSALPLSGAKNVYLARTFAYVADGQNGLAIVDITTPLQPRLDQVFNGDGCINDLQDVKLGITNASECAYLAGAATGCARCN